VTGAADLLAPADGAAVAQGNPVIVLTLLLVVTMTSRIS
jgi:hypothetical protein